MSELDDSEIIKNVLNGNRDDFEIILKRYEAYIFTIISKHLPPDVVEDAAQEVFIRIYRALPSYRAEAPFKHWISKIAVRYCYDFWRERYRSKEVTMASLSEEHSKWVETIASGQSQECFDREEALKDSREVLQWALNKLTAQERTLVTLLYLEELSTKEAADLLGWSVVNVKVKAFRLRGKLREIISALLDKKGGYDETA